MTNVDHKFECECVSPVDQCPSFLTHASVRGLPEGQTINLFYYATVTNQHDTGLPHQYVLEGVATNDTERMTFRDASPGGTEGWVWNGTILDFFVPSQIPGCEIQPVFGLGQPIVGSPGTESVKIADIVCNEVPQCSESNCQVDFNASVYGDAAHPLTVEVTIDGTQYSTEIDAYGTIASVPAGASYSGARVVEPFTIDAICILTSPSSGVVPDQSPFAGILVECTSSEEIDIVQPVDPIFNLPLCDRFCSPVDFVTNPPHQCPPDVAAYACPDSPTGCFCEEVAIHERPCITLCGFGSSDLVTAPWITAVAGGKSISNGAPVVDDQIFFRASIGDTDGMQGLVAFFDESATVQNLHSAGGHSVSSTGVVELDTSSLADGSHELVLVAVDNHPDFPTPAVARMPFVVEHADPCAEDHAGPTISFATPAPGSSPLPGQLWISVNSSDPSGVDRVQFFVDGQMRHNDTHAPFGYTWWAGVGSHQLKARAWDECGNSSEVQMPITIDDPCSGVTPVEVSITNLADGDWLEPAVYHVEAAITDVDQVGIDHVEFQVDDFTPYTTQTPPWQSNGYYLLSQGPVDIQVRVYDNCGRTDTANLTINISENATVCSIDTGPPTVAIASPNDGAQLSPGEITVEGDVIEDTVLLAGALWADGQPKSTILSPIPTQYNFPWQATPGSHALHLRAADVCWNVGISPIIQVNVGPSGFGGIYLPWPAAPYLHVLDGPVHPAGKPIVDARIVDFGILSLGGLGAVKPISFVNDGNGELVITGFDFVGTGFALFPSPVLPIVVPPYQEGTIQVQALADSAGEMRATLNLTSNLGQPLSVELASRVRSKQASFTDGFEGGGLSLWNAAQGLVAVSPAAALAGRLGLEVQLQGASYNYARVLKDVGSAAFVKTRLTIDTENLAMGSSERLNLVSAHGSGVVVTYAQLRLQNGARQARVLVRNDDGGMQGSDWLSLPAGQVVLELEWQAAIEGLSDGYAKLSLIQGIGVSFGVSVDGVDNDGSRIAKIYYGAAWGLASGTSGTLMIDDVSIWY